jgi:hypothetical protein
MPFETTKTLQQVNHSPATASARLSMLDTMRRTVKLSGVRGLYFGLPICLLQTSGKVGIRFAAFEALKPVVGAHNVVVAGCLAGAIEAALWVTPCERIKVLRQIQVGEASPRHPVSWVASLRRLAGEGVVSSLYRGIGPTVLRNGGTVGFRFGAHGYLMERLTASIGGKRAWHSAAAGAAVGAVSTVLNNPIDVVKSHQQATSSGSMAGLARTLYAQGGVAAFTAGIGPRLWKISLGQAIIFSSFEHVTVAVGRVFGEESGGGGA